jgi:hypothetical protein
MSLILVKNKFSKFVRHYTMNLKHAVLTNNLSSITAEKNCLII